MDSSVCRKATYLALLSAALTCAQTVPQPDWRRIGNTALELELASTASGAVDRVWHSPDGNRLFARTASGRVFETSDYEHWAPSVNAEPPPNNTGLAARLPEPGARTGGARDHLYAVGMQAWRSDDGGLHWSNLTEYRSLSILGGPLADLSVAPGNRDDVVVAGRTGVWRSLDGGRSWVGLNSGLPNLPVRRIVALPAATQSLRIAIPDAEVEWRPGEKTAWRLAEGATAQADQVRRRELSQLHGTEITAVTTAADTIYAGSVDGRLWATTNAGRTWRTFPAPPDAGPVAGIQVDSRDPLWAVAAIAGRQRGRVLRTINGGVFWEDISDASPLPTVNAVAADRASGAIYAATARGVYAASANTAPVAWLTLAGLPQAAAVDVRLDEGANQLYVALEGYGIYAAIAPHRSPDPRVVSAADLKPRPAAPGALVTVLGRSVDAARAGNSTAPVLASTPGQSQIQVPFEATGARVDLSLTSASGTTSHSLPLQPVAPAIFVDAEGNPLITNADTGMLLDAATPVRPGTRLQIFATGLGRVRPDWPTGVVAPLQDAPRVIAALRVYLDREPLEATRATLAPGYVGFYLVEVQIPSILNAGTAELYIESDNNQSNRVKLYIEQ
jgi:uncharacterized protein (TIGR03437 family)